MPKNLFSFRNAALILGLFVAILGLFVLAGWNFGISAFTHVILGLVTMVANTALGMLLCGVQLIVFSRKASPKPIRYFAIVLAVFVILLGAASLSEDLVDWDFGIDRLLFRDTPVATNSSQSGRMSPTTAFCFILSGIALGAAGLSFSKKRWRPLILAMATAVATISILALTGYTVVALFRYSGWNYTGMAVQTAMGFLCVAAGIVMVVRADEPLKWSMGWLPTVGFIAGIASLLATAGIVYNSAKEMITAARWVSHTQEVLKEIREITTGLAELESSQRSYLLLGDEQVLGSRDETKKRILEDFEHVQTLTSDNPRQQAALLPLRPLVDKRIAFGDLTISVRRKEGFAAAQQLHASGTGRALSAEAQRALLAMADEEDRLLKDRMKHSRDISATTFLLLPIGFFLSVTLLLVGLFFLNDGLGDKQRAERTIRESETRLAGIVNSAMDAIISMDRAQKVVLFNGAAEKMFRCSAAAAIGKPIEQFIPQRYRGQHRLHVDGFEQTGVTSRSMRSLGAIYGLRADDDEFPIEASISQVDVSGQTIFTVILRDITERKRAEEDAALLSAIVESSNDAIIGKDMNGIVTNWNAGAQYMFGYSAGEMVAQSITRIIPPDRLDEEVTILAQLKRGERMKHFETVRQTKDGGLIDVSVTVSPIKDSAGKVLGASKVARDITERKRAEAALRESDETLRIVTENARVGLVMVNRERCYSFANAAYAEMLGLPSTSLVGLRVADVLVPLYEDQIRPHLDRAFAGERVAYDLQKQSPEGHRFYAVRYEPTRVDGVVSLVVVVITDITERKRAEAELGVTQARLSSALEAGSIGTWTWDIANDNLTADEYTARMFSIDADAAAKGLPAQAYLRAVLEQDQPGVEAALAAAIQSCGHYDIEYRVRQKDGELRWLQARGRVDGDGARNAVSFHGAVMDITERKHAEEALAQIQEQFRSMVNAMCQLAWMAQPDGYLYWYNQRWYEFTGTTLEQMEGWGWQRVHDPDMLPKIVEGWKASVATGEPFEMNFPLRAANGRFHWFLTRAFPLKDSAGQVVRWIGTNTDISQMREAEAEIQRLNTDLEKRVVERTAQLESANKELEAFSYSVSHDLRAPLRAVDGFSRAVLEEYGPQLPPDGQEYLQDIRNGAQQMGNLIDDLLTFSRLSRAPLKSERVATVRVVHEALEDLRLQRQGRKIDMRVGDLPSCEGDPALLKQVWINLLSNAIKYTGKRESAVVEIGFKMEQNENVYFVRDNGTGFDMRYAHKLFGVFQRLHRAEEYEGTGVGLAIVQRIIVRHGGRIWADSAVDNGTTFYFTLNEGKIL